MPHLSRVLQLHTAFTSAGSAGEVVLSDQVPEGEIWKITRYTFQLRTDELTLVTSFIDRQGERLLINQWPAPANPFLYVDTWEFDLSEGQRLGLELTGQGANDVIDLFAYGFIVVQRPN